ncbi:15518_t:CDS:2 [Rhizophagus irregularis]|nr:15518_t:CDS:2 [Rhizophagus irregularis]
MDWPITGKAAGYVRAKSLPNIGEWTEFSPADIRTFCGEINRPNPEYTAPTKPKTPWLTSLVDADFPLKPSWSLKENQKMGNKGGGKRISKKVVQYLQAYFYAELVREKELSVEDIPEIKTIKGWIGRYSASSKKEMSEKALEQNAIEENNFVARQEEIDTESTTHSRAKKRQKRS